jgi:molecular chaperone Hsp33
LKDEDQLVTLRIQGDGPVGVVLASANGRGEVRGLVGNPRPDIEQVNDRGKLNVAGAVGKSGYLTVTRDLGMREPYSSMVELVSGEVGEDLAHYFQRSEQIPSAVGIGVFVRADGSVEAAGGYIVQILAGMSDQEVGEIEAIIGSLPHPTTMLRSGETPEQILTRIFPGGYEMLERQDVRFHCPCTRDRAQRALVLLGVDALIELTNDDAEKGFTEAVCEFCAAIYRFTSAEMQELVAQAE